MQPLYTLGERLKLPKYSNWRTLYPVRQGDVLFCFIGMRTGWGKNWEFYPLTPASRSTTGINVEGFAPLSTKSMTYYGKDRAQGAVKAIEDRSMRLDNGYFSDANALRTVTAMETEKSRKFLTDSIERMTRQRDDSLKRALTMQAIHDAHPWEEFQLETLAQTVLHFRLLAKSTQDAIAFAQKKLEEECQ